MSVQENVFLQLIRLGIGKTNIEPLPEKVDWSKVRALADAQGLSAIVLDGLDAVQEVNSSKNPKSLPLQMKLEWIGDVLQNYEQRYKQYENAINTLAGFYNRHGFKMMLLKGLACDLDWPKPEHRPCGDIDIWQFGKQLEADECLIKETGIKVDDSHHHHTVFNWKGVSVENHYDLINVHDYKSSKEIEKILKKLGSDDSHFVEVCGERVYLPSPDLHALFLIRHSSAHFASTYITIRHVLDWAFFVEKHTEEINWEWLINVLEEYHMKDFFNCINAICVGDLGFNARIFPCVQFDPFLKDRILQDIFSPKYTIEEPKSLIPKLLYKYRRWYGNGWKQKLCYRESRMSGFMTNLWAHILKPS